jgi:hypothetical protein
MAPDATASYATLPASFGLEPTVYAKPAVKVRARAHTHALPPARRAARPQTRFGGWLPRACLEIQNA